MVHIGGVAPELLEHLAGLQAVHAREAVIGRAEDVGAVAGERQRGDARQMRALKPPQALARLQLPHLQRACSLNLNTRKLGCRIYTRV